VESELLFDQASPASQPLFHAAVQTWLAKRFGQATDVQARAWRAATEHRHVLVAAPTGSGKTLAAFLSSINDLVEAGLERALADEVHVVYVSPLKALSNDIEKNLQEPLSGIRAELLASAGRDVPIRVAVRTGDTTSRERNLMRRQPPHILVTTPESLYILLTSESGRQMLRSTRRIIVDELHAVAATKRGAHLMLTLERLQCLCTVPPRRIGLSATVKPVEGMARFLVGDRDEPVTIVDAGHVRARDLELELPLSPLSAVMANEVWEEIYDRLAQLVRDHRTTLIFVNQRRVAERTARHLAERLGEEHVAAHHGSLARAHRLQAEQRLRAGELRVLVATSSLELGIDIGDVNLVCQLGSPRAVGTLLQRVGRAGHSIGGTPKGRLFPLSLDDLLECAALLHAVRQGELERLRVPRAPLDVLAQQIVAEVAGREWPLKDLYDAFRRAWPYRELERAQFQQVVQMLADGYTTRRGRRGAYLHYDAVNEMLRPRRGARMTAVMNAGVIPDQFDYDVVLVPEEHRIGTLNEDFAFESLAGDIFQLGNTSYRVIKVETGKMYVADAKGQPPSMPFWLGEGLSRSDELSQAVAQLNGRVAEELRTGRSACENWFAEELKLPVPAQRQLLDYLERAYAALGALPTTDTVVMERFFDEVGDTHLVIHSPWGARINRAWGLALRKRFCRKFNFELQASALDDSIVLSLGAAQSFPLREVAGYLRAASVRELLVQALLDAPMFGTRWRWNATAALAVQRMRNGRRLPPQFQRSDAEDLLCHVFPEQVACGENIVGDRAIPDHPLVTQTVADCLHETMDIDGLEQLLRRIEDGQLAIVCRDLPEPSVLSHAVLNARPYAFLDDGEAEARRTRAVSVQSQHELPAVPAFGGVTAAAIEQVRQEAWPELRDADELHDALVVFGFLTAAELADSRGFAAGAPPAAQLVEDLQSQMRVAALQVGGGVLYGAAERLHELLAVLPGVVSSPQVRPTRSERPSADTALRELVRSRLELLGPVSEAQLATPLAVEPPAIQAALLALEAEGAVMRGSFTSAAAEEWCERRLLARMYRYSRDRRRAAVRPVTAAQFQRFLFRWQRITGEDGRRMGEEGLLAALRQLEGCAAPVSVWEEDLLPARVQEYLPVMLDRLCAAGRVAWHRPARANAAEPRKSGPVRGTPIVVCERGTLHYWLGAGEQPAEDPPLSAKARQIAAELNSRGASFALDLMQATGMIRSELEAALGELVSYGLVHCDSFAGLRALTQRRATERRRLRRGFARAGIEEAGRWALTSHTQAKPMPAGGLAAPEVEHIARVLLRRYGVVFRKLLEREVGLPAWRELFYVYRRLEARGEALGGRFVGGFAGEQFALPQASEALRRIPEAGTGERVGLSAADPLNLVGVLTPGDKVPRLRGNRVLYEDGVPVAMHTRGTSRQIGAGNPDAPVEWERRSILIRKARTGGAHSVEQPG
jgi:ATP-dependent Lhr-like helicase